MSLIEKAYFILDEVEERWRMPRRDFAYLAENGLLRLSARLFGAHLEFGYLDQGQDDEWFTVPTEQIWFEGLQDLRKQDAFLLFRDGQVEIRYFAAPDREYRRLMHGAGDILVRFGDVVVRREERDRVEAQHALTQGSGNRGLQHSADYSDVRCAGASYHLGPLQARVVRYLHHAARDGVPWCFGKTLLAKAGSSSARLADVFKSQRHWRQLIDSDGRGNYRLRSP